MARMVNCVKLGREAEGLDFPPVPGELGQRATVGDSELAQQRRDVALDGAHGEVQPAGDLLVGQMLPDQREHLGLALGDAGVGE